MASYSHFRMRRFHHRLPSNSVCRANLCAVERFFWAPFYSKRRDGKKCATRFLWNRRSVSWLKLMMYRNTLFNRRAQQPFAYENESQQKECGATLPWLFISFGRRYTLLAFQLQRPLLSSIHSNSMVG